MAKYMGTFDWIKIFDELKNKGIKILHRTALEAVYEGNNRALSVILNRLEKRGIIKRVAKNWYAIAPCDIWEITSTVFPSAYLSMEWALHYHEVLNQKIEIITLVWLGKTKTIRTRHYTFELHKISKKLYFGFDNKFIAEPEKALLDLIYIRKKAPRELNFELLDKNKLKNYVSRFPNYVNRILESII